MEGSIRLDENFFAMATSTGAVEVDDASADRVAEGTAAAAPVRAHAAARPSSSSSDHAKSSSTCLGVPLPQTSQLGVVGFGPVDVEPSGDDPFTRDASWGSEGAISSASYNFIQSADLSEYATVDHTPPSIFAEMLAANDTESIISIDPNPLGAAPATLPPGRGFVGIAGEPASPASTSVRRDGAAVDFASGSLRAAKAANLHPTGSGRRLKETAAMGDLGGRDGGAAAAPGELSVIRGRRGITPGTPVLIGTESEMAAAMGRAHYRHAEHAPYCDFRVLGEVVSNSGNYVRVRFFQGAPTAAWVRDTVAIAVQGEGAAAGEDQRLHFLDLTSDGAIGQQLAAAERDGYAAGDAVAGAAGAAEAGGGGPCLVSHTFHHIGVVPLLDVLLVAHKVDLHSALSIRRFHDVIRLIDRFRDEMDCRESALARRRTAAILGLRSVAQLSLGDAAGALETANEFAALLPAEVEAHCRVIAALLEMGRCDDALAALDQCRASCDPAAIGSDRELGALVHHLKLQRLYEASSLLHRSRAATAPRSALAIATPRAPDEIAVLRSAAVAAASQQSKKESAHLLDCLATRPVLRAAVNVQESCLLVEDEEPSIAVANLAWVRGARSAQSPAQDPNSNSSLRQCERCGFPLRPKAEVMARVKDVCPELAHRVRQRYPARDHIVLDFATWFADGAVVPVQLGFCSEACETSAWRAFLWAEGVLTLERPRLGAFGAAAEGGDTMATSHLVPTPSHTIAPLPAHELREGASPLSSGGRDASGQIGDGAISGVTTSVRIAAMQVLGPLRATLTAAMVPRDAPPWTIAALGAATAWARVVAAVVAFLFFPEDTNAPQANGGEAPRCAFAKCLFTLLKRFAPAGRSRRVHVTPIAVGMPLADPHRLEDVPSGEVFEALCAAVGVPFLAHFCCATPLNPAALFVGHGANMTYRGGGAKDQAKGRSDGNTRAAAAAKRMQGSRETVNGLQGGADDRAVENLAVPQRLTDETAGAGAAGGGGLDPCSASGWSIASRKSCSASTSTRRPELAEVNAETCRALVEQARVQLAAALASLAAAPSSEEASPLSLSSRSVVDDARGCGSTPAPLDDNDWIASLFGVWWVEESAAKVGARSTAAVPASSSFASDWRLALLTRFMGAGELQGQLFEFLRQSVGITPVMPLRDAGGPALPEHLCESWDRVCREEWEAVLALYPLISLAHSFGVSDMSEHVKTPRAMHTRCPTQADRTIEGSNRRVAPAAAGDETAGGVGEAAGGSGESRRRSSPVDLMSTAGALSIDSGNSNDQFDWTGSCYHGISESLDSHARGNAMVTTRALLVRAPAPSVTTPEGAPVSSQCDTDDDATLCAQAVFHVTPHTHARHKASPPPSPPSPSPSSSQPQQQQPASGYHRSGDASGAKRPCYASQVDDRGSVCCGIAALRRSLVAGVALSAADAISLPHDAHLRCCSL